MSKKYLKIIIASLIGGVTGVLAVTGFRFLEERRKNVVEDFTVYVKAGTKFGDLSELLTAKVKNIKEVERCFKRENPSGNIKPGYYSFKANTTNQSLVRHLSKGWQSPYKLTLSGNIRGLEKLAGVLGKKMMHDSTEFITYFNDPQVWEKYNLKKETLQSIILPNTYEMYWTNTPEEFVERMKKEYDKFWTPERLQKAKDLNLSKEEVSILASIVCEESNYKPELPAIAGVYINRLKKGMRLEADPTVKFALNDPTIKRILFRHLEVDSPYNTYKNTGLPPGPITIPSIAGIDAVLNYQRHNYIYFCANEKLDGTHKFARTLSEHNRNARAYQSAISRLKF